MGPSTVPRPDGYFRDFPAVIRHSNCEAKGVLRLRNTRSRLLNLLVCIFCVAASSSLHAQHASDDPVAAADDAFGLTMGLESIGMYGPQGVRGFSPQVAGNVRIDGLYFDQQGYLSNRVVDGSTIRVGVSESAYPFPAPTGIVDYSLRSAEAATPSASAVVSAGPFDAGGASVDGVIPLTQELRLPIGVSYQDESQSLAGSFPGYSARYISLGATPQWKPDDRISIRLIVDHSETTRADTMPILFTAGDYAPPYLPRRYLGQHWARGDTSADNYGGLLKARLTTHWSLAAGIFRSIYNSPVSYTDLYLNAQPDGSADRSIVAYPDQSISSTSGEVRLTGQFLAGSWSNTFFLMTRGRDTSSKYGGEDESDLGQMSVGATTQFPEPQFRFTQQTLDTTKLYSTGAAYKLGWNKRMELALGVQQEFYKAVETVPQFPIQRRSDDPLRAYFSGAEYLTSKLTVYEGYTQGLEDSGIAPGTAANPNAILPVTRTWQADAGVRYLLTSKVKVIVGVFEIHKPYFNLDEDNVDRQLGTQRAQGVEVSLSGEPLPNLHLTAGALLGRVSISGFDLAAQGIGRDAFGQPRSQGSMTANYSIPFWPAFSVDATFQHYGAAPASVNDAVIGPAIDTASVGARYRLTVMDAPATLRVLVQNVTDKYVEATGFTPGWYAVPPRSIFAYLTVDLGGRR
jgi:iron complex outermembrane recepter protein